MMNMHLMNRSGLAAIAAATAFLTTPALAQDAAPVAADPAPIVADTPLPTDPAPAPAATKDSLAPTPVAKATRTAKAVKTTRVVHTATAAAPTPRATRSVTPAAAAPVAIAAKTIPVTVQADPAMVAPIPEPVAAAPITPVADNGTNDMLPIAGAAGLGILALAGAGFAIRRRRRDDEVVAEDNWVEPANVADAPIVEPMVESPIATAPIPAFAWSDQPVTAAPIVAAPAEASSDLSRIEAAKRGPTPDNPSASLKKRLARAAFFDQRDRLVAAGKAVPVDALAGLPEAMDPVEPQPQPVSRTKPVLGMSFKRRFQSV